MGRFGPHVLQTSKHRLLVVETKIERERLFVESEDNVTSSTVNDK